MAAFTDADAFHKEYCHGKLLKYYPLCKYSKSMTLTKFSDMRNSMPLDMLRIHIAPVGFEVDRIVLPAKKMKADTVWLVLHNNPTEDEGLSFADKIERQLKESSIECKREMADRTDLFDSLRAFKGIIAKESNHTVFVNVSVGSKIQAIAAMMACMMFGDRSHVRPYYVVPDSYATIPKEQETKGLKTIKTLPEYRIETPNTNLIKCLEIIADSPGQRLSKKDLKDKALGESLIIVEKTDNKDQSAYMSLNKNLLHPLESKWGFINIEKIGNKHIVSLTDEGRHALTFLGYNTKN